MRVKLSIYIDEDLVSWLRGLSYSSEITPRTWKVCEILEDVLPDALESWEKNHKDISSIHNNRKLFI